MCINNDDAELKSIQSKEAPFAAWKVLWKDGHPPYYDTDSYGPGACQIEGQVDYSENPCGLHLFRTLRRAEFIARVVPDYRVVQVTVDPKDVIAADWESISVTKLVIDIFDWELACLPELEEKTRIISFDKNVAFRRPRI